MSPEPKFKRHIAYKLRIGDILLGKPIFEQERFKCLNLNNKDIVRVNVIGNIVERYDSEGEKKYSFLKLDDGSGQISLKSFGDDIEKTKDITQGQTVSVIGVLRNWNNETYILPEAIKQQDPKYLLIRKLELEKQQSQNAKPVENKEQQVELKDKILEIIKKAEQDNGIDTDKVNISLRESSPEIINQEIQKLLEEGRIFEPRPGRLRFLG